MGSGELFTHLLRPLKRVCNPVLLDLPGHGRSEGSSRAEHYLPEQLVHDLRSILERLQLSPLLLYGYSMGGRLALHFTLAYPGLVNGLVLEGAGPGPEDPAERTRRREEEEKRAEEIEADYLRFLERWMSLPLFTGGSSQDSETDRKANGNVVAKDGSVQSERDLYAERTILYRRVMERQNPAWMAAALRGFGQGVTPPLGERLGELELPMLLISGERDERYRKIHREMADKIPRATVVAVPGAAHRVHIDQPGLLLNELTTFIQSHYP